MLPESSQHLGSKVKEASFLIVDFNISDIRTKLSKMKKLPPSLTPTFLHDFDPCDPLPTIIEVAHPLTPTSYDFVLIVFVSDTCPQLLAIRRYKETNWLRGAHVYKWKTNVKILSWSDIDTYHIAMLVLSHLHAQTLLSEWDMSSTYMVLVLTKALEMAGDKDECDNDDRMEEWLNDYVVNIVIVVAYVPIFRANLRIVFSMVNRSTHNPGLGFGWGSSGSLWYADEFPAPRCSIMVLQNIDTANY